MWFKYDRDDLCVNKLQFVPVIFEPPCNYNLCVKVKGDKVRPRTVHEGPEGK